MYDVVIVGGGIGGAAAAFELSKERRLKICLLYRKAADGSSFTNQKWKHSGLLFEQEAMARLLWQSYWTTEGTVYDEFIVGERRAHFVSADGEALAKRERLWKEWGLPGGRREPAGCDAFVRRGFAVCETPDCVIDYPALVARLLRESAANGVDVVSDAEFQRLQLGADGVAGIDFRKSGQRHSLSCRWCVLACGARAKAILEVMGLPTQLQLLQSTIVRLEGRIVDHVTVFLGEPGAAPMLNLVPFEHSTLISDTSCRLTRDVDDRSPDDAAAAAMLANLAALFRLTELPRYEAWGCHKVRLANDSLDDYPYVTKPSIRGLLAVDPLKASLMYAFASNVKEAILGAQR